MPKRKALTKTSTHITARPTHPRRLVVADDDGSFLRNYRLGAGVDHFTGAFIRPRESTISGFFARMSYGESE